MTERLLMGQNSNNDFGLYVSKPGVNVHSAAADPWGYQEEFRFYGDEDASPWYKGWTLFGTDNYYTPPHTESNKLKEGNFLQLYEDDTGGECQFIFTSDCAIPDTGGNGRSAAPDAIPPFSGSKYPEFEMNVRNVLWGEHDSIQINRLSFIMNDHMVSHPMEFNGGSYYQETGFGTAIRLFVNHPNNSEQRTDRHWPFGGDVGDWWDVGDLIDIYLANLDITVRTKITYIFSYRDFDVSKLGEYGFPYFNDLSLNDTYTNISKMHPAPVSYDKGVHFNNTYSSTSDSFTISGIPITYREESGVPGDWESAFTTWDFSQKNIMINPIPLANGAVRPSSASSIETNEAGNMRVQTRSSDGWKQISYYVDAGTLPGDPNLSPFTARQGPRWSFTSAWHNGFDIEVKYSDTNETDNFFMDTAAGVGSGASGQVYHLSFPYHPTRVPVGQNPISITHTGFYRPETPVGNAASHWSANSESQILALKFQRYEGPRGSAGDNIWDIASVRAKTFGTDRGLPAHPNSLDNLLFTTGPLGAGGVELMHAGLVHQTGIVKVGTSNDAVGSSGGRDDWDDDPLPTGVVELAHPLPYIPFILFQRFDGAAVQAGNPVSAFPANQLDISYCGSMGAADLGILEYKSSHTDPTMMSGFRGYSFSKNVSRPGGGTYSEIFTGPNDAVLAPNEPGIERNCDVDYPYPNWPFTSPHPNPGKNGQYGHPAGFGYFENENAPRPIEMACAPGPPSSEGPLQGPKKWDHTMDGGVWNVDGSVGAWEPKANFDWTIGWNGGASAGTIPVDRHLGNGYRTASSGGVGGFGPQQPYDRRGHRLNVHAPGDHDDTQPGNSWWHQYHSLWGDWHMGHVYNGANASAKGWAANATRGFGRQAAPRINSSPGIIYKWMVMETIKMRTFAYCRAGKDRFEITARNALGLEGNEDASHGKYQRADAGETLEYMWDQKDDTANGVLPPSAYTAEHITDWGKTDETVFSGGRLLHTVHGSGTNQKHEYIPGAHMGGSSSFYLHKRAPWDWGGSQTWPNKDGIGPYGVEGAHDSLGDPFFENPDIFDDWDSIYAPLVPVGSEARVDFDPWGAFPAEWGQQRVQTTGRGGMYAQPYPGLSGYARGEYVLAHPIIGNVSMVDHWASAFKAGYCTHTHDTMLNNYSLPTGAFDFPTGSGHSVIALYNYQHGRSQDGTTLVDNLGCHDPIHWPPGGLLQASFNPLPGLGIPEGFGPNANGGFATQTGGLGPYPDGVTEGRVTEGISHPRGVSQYANNSTIEPYTINQTYDLVHNNTETGQCSYRYYVLRIPANLNASQLVSNLPDNAGLIG